MIFVQGNLYEQPLTSRLQVMALNYLIVLPIMSVNHIQYLTLTGDYI